eukprot:CAMPEP_0197071362 /NCGR_PEP_ID=MMETSP1384-20130603/206042_1 /TAXON_ID=29189 /ORGANISM="Ammonia sp." /LENGTH=73 /DNA_ID=CAMNT_0042509985 /DNA_START=28 /DNA_END=245 /DNA_ORIENTATION=+
MAKNIEAGVAELVKRALPTFNYHSKMVPSICDKLEHFVNYTLAFHALVYQIKELMNKGKYNWAPLQIDIWIIP